MSTLRPDPEDVLGQLGWVRALARGLLRDVHAAEDVAQSACLLALERPPRERGHLRAWLARVTRTLARQEVRSSRARTSRERAAAGARSSPSTFEVYARGQRQSRVADAVLELPEPYASTVLYHYLDGLSAPEVAERMSTSPAAVRKRLERARAMLRERLDGEFGGGVERWAVLLLGPPARGVASGSAAGTVTVIGGLWMGNKIMWAVGCLALAGLATLAMWRGEESVGARGSGAAEPGAATTLIAPSVLERAEPARRDVVAPATSETGEESVGLAAATEDDETVLRVRAVDPSGEILTRGLVECRWDTVARFDMSPTQRHVQAEMAGEVTEIVLPAAALEALVSASVEGGDPEPPVRVSELRDGRSGRVVHDVDVPVGAEHEGPFVSGTITVDGVRRCPAGLRVFLQSHGQCWIHHASATYRLGPRYTDEIELFVTSDETVPAQFRLAPGDEPVVELALETGRELVVHVLDDASGAPAPGARIVLQVHAEIERRRGAVLHQGNELYRTADAAGRCHFTGIPTRGMIAIVQPLAAGGTLPLLQKSLTPKMDERLEVEVRVRELKQIDTRVFGSLPALEGSAVDARRVVRFRSTHGVPAIARSADVASDGSWSIDLPSHQVWTVWAEQDGARRSEDSWVELRGEAEHGPVPIGWRGTHEVRLVLVDVPPTGRISVVVREKDPPARQRFELEAAGIDITRTLELSGPAEIELVVGPEGSDSELGTRHGATVDPTREREVVVALGAGEARGATVRIAGATPIGRAELLLVDPFVPEGERPAMVLVELEDGASTADQVIAPGTWMYLVRHPEYPGFVAGMLEVRGYAPIAIDWRGERVPRGKLGAGIGIDAVGGRSLADVPLGMRRHPWPAEYEDALELWMPEGCEYSAYEEWDGLEPGRDR